MARRSERARAVFCAAVALFFGSEAPSSWSRLWRAAFRPSCGSGSPRIFEFFDYGNDVYGVRVERSLLCVGDRLGPTGEFDQVFQCPPSSTLQGWLNSSQDIMDQARATGDARSLHPGPDPTTISEDNEKIQHCFDAVLVFQCNT